jgi:ribose transport system permease protein
MADRSQLAPEHGATLANEGRVGEDAGHPVVTGAESRAAKRLLIALWMRPLSAVIAAFVLIVVGFSVLNPEIFPSVANVRNMSLDASITLILAVGAAYVVITGNLDLSIGSVLVFAGVVSAKTMDAVGGSGVLPSVIGLVAALAAGGAWGALNGVLITRARLNSIIVTLASLGSALGLAQVLTGGQDLVDIPQSMSDFGNGRAMGIPNVVFVTAVVVVIGGVVLARTRFGRFTYAIGSSEQAARRAALPVERHLLTVFVISGALAGLAGWLALARFSTTAIGGHSLDTFNALTGVLLGGVSLFGGAGAMLGVFFGTLIPIVLANGLVISGVQSFWQQVVIGGVLVVAVYLDRLRRERADGGT